VHPTATLTEASLLSGSPKREHTKDASGGLLRTIGGGGFGILLAKDFGSVLSMHREARASALAALREIYDGDWTRHVGTDGGKTLHWWGKVGLIAGCTPTIDRHHAVMGAMGERFVLVRMPKLDEHAQATAAIKHARRSAQMRAELGDAVAALLEGEITEQHKRSEADTERLIDLAVLVVRCRSAVERDGYSREIELIPDAEAPARLVNQLERLLAGLRVIGAANEAAWRVLQSAALDSIPLLRRKVIDTLVAAIGETRTADVAEAIGYPLRTTERALEDLTAHGVLVVNHYGPGKATTWQISDWTADHWKAATSPDLSEGISTNSRRTHTEDISGEVGNAAWTAPSANGSAASGGHGERDGWRSNADNAEPDPLTAHSNGSEVGEHDRTDEELQDVIDSSGPASEISALSSEVGSDPGSLAPSPSIGALERLGEAQLLGDIERQDEPDVCELGAAA
jgi:hypothetical protein